jgi:hypothetical protein
MLICLMEQLHAYMNVSEFYHIFYKYVLSFKYVLSTAQLPNKYHYYYHYYFEIYQRDILIIFNSKQYIPLSNVELTLYFKLCDL